MSLRAEGACETRNWSEEPYFALNDEELSLAKVVTRFTGDITGEGAADYLMVYTSQDAGAFVGMERIAGSIGGRTGSFVVQLRGSFWRRRWQQTGR